MVWLVEAHPEFEPELDSLAPGVREQLQAAILVLSRHGPRLGRPHVDTLQGSRYANMKELRFNADGGVWRVAFAFDPRRKAVLLVAGDKKGVNARRFYRELIRTADDRFDRHLNGQR